jgi:hypothetical protein
VAAGTAVIGGLILGGIPLWKNVIKPYIEKLKEQQAQGRKVQKRSVQDEYLDELVADAELVEFLSQLSDEFDAAF